VDRVIGTGRNGLAGGAAYCASKHGVLGFSKALMMDVRQQGMRVIMVSELDIRPTNP
jgi:NAD(P)-dependent dehydrogenase (short-subunit alcohol dehydrogenase family)